MASLYSGNDIESQGGTQFVSEIKYFLATDEFQKTKNRVCNVQNKNDKDFFIECVGHVVQISNPVSFTSLDTKNFSQSLGQSKDYDVGSNFFSANAVKNSLTSRNPLDFPTRHPRLLICDNGTICVADDAYVHFANEDAYLGKNQFKYALLFLWLNRHSNFNSINSIYTDFLAVLQKRYSENLCSVLQWNAPLVQTRFEQLINDYTYDEVPHYLEEKDIVEDDFTKTLKKLSILLNDALNKKRLIDFLREQNILDVLPEEKETNSTSKSSLASPLPHSFFPTQIIYYGVPGCGKSYKVNQVIDAELAKYGITNKDEHKVRCVFHPEYCNADFVGQIYPYVLPDNKGVEYRFKQGPFAEIIRRAYLNPDKPYFLIIEEINRGNAAAIFGEMFQLLDRIEAGDEPDKSTENTYTKGWSSYGVDNIDVNAYIRQNKTGKDDVITYAEFVKYDNLVNFKVNTAIRLPPNLSVYATMNTSDQNVFTMDNAFQRRFKSKMIKNDLEDSTQYNLQIDDTGVCWGDFREWINTKILAPETGFRKAEDKCLGGWFIKGEKKTDEKGNIIDEYNPIPKDEFAEKVLKYLWNDVFKRNAAENIFARDKVTSLTSLIDIFESSDKFAAFENVFVLTENDKAQLQPSKK